MTPRDAVIRLMSEIILFTDRPDYCRPKSVCDAFDVLLKEHDINMSYVYKHYGDWYDQDEAESEQE
jgi:hypothetical protein